MPCRSTRNCLAFSAERAPTEPEDTRRRVAGLRPSPSSPAEETNPAKDVDPPDDTHLPPRTQRDLVSWTKHAVAVSLTSRAYASTATPSSHPSAKRRPSPPIKTPTMSGKGKALTPRPALNKAKKEAQAARRKRIQAGIVVALVAWGAYATVTSETGVKTVAGACRSWAGGSFAPELDPTMHPLSAWSLPENITLFRPSPSSNEPTCLPWSNQRQVYRTPSADSPADAGPLTAFAADALIVVPRAALNDTFVLLRRNLGMGVESKTVQETGKITYSVPEEDVEAPDGDDDVPVSLAVFHSDPEVLAGMRICRLAKVGEEGKVVGVGIFRDPTYDTPQCPWSSTPPADEPITRWIHVAAAVRFPLTDDGSPIVVRRFVTELGTGYAQDFSEIWEKGQQIEFLSGSVEGQDVARVGGEDGEVEAEDQMQGAVAENPGEE
uniref:SET domain-containing protein n=1 Tax=Mycena chlorophos TaxID=658473 RepID=A0ABQ0LEQ3_MYCCL|nr:predicted protein [Mycena chlorophos]